MHIDGDISMAINV